MKCIATILLIVIIYSCGQSENHDTEPTVLDETEILDTFEYVSYANFYSENEEGFLEDIEQRYIEYKAQFDTVVIDQTPYYIVEGDILMSEDELFFHFENAQSFGESDKLLLSVYDGEISKVEDSRAINFAIIKSTFTNTEYNLIKRYMRIATEDWERVCNINFIHKEHLDAKLRPNDNPNELYFVVKNFNSSGKFIAKAFFPYYPKYRKKILIDDSFFSSRFSPEGILRHELGHVIGFRHEHIRSGAPAVCPNENFNNAIELTDYDPKSVMHYFCGDVGTKELEISELDSIGAVIIYPW